jgi:hypothetical protein
MARQTLLTTIHASSQKRLKGSPKIMGSTLSHKGTEKHMPIKGISPSTNEIRDGLRMETDKVGGQG